MSALAALSPLDAGTLATSRAADAMLVPSNGRWFVAGAPRQRRIPASGSGHLKVALHQGNSDEGDRPMSFASSAARDVAPPEEVPSEHEIREAVAEAIDDLGLSTKDLARDADMTPPAVRSWVERRNTMSLTAAVRLARMNPRFRDALARLIGIEDDVLRHQELQRELARFHRTMDRLMPGGGK